MGRTGESRTTEVRNAAKKAALYTISGRFSQKGQDELRRRLPVSEHIEFLELGFLQKVVLKILNVDLQRHLATLDREKLLAELRYTDTLSRTALHWAAEQDDHEAVKTLLSFGAEVDARTSGGRTPPSLLAAAKTARSFKSLIHYHADVNAKEKAGWSIIHLAARYGSLEVLEKLVGCHVNIDAQTPGGGTPLIYATHANQFKVVKRLLEWGANVEAVYRGGNTALLFAVSENSHESLRLLINKGANHLHVNDSGETIWHRAAKVADAKTVSILEEIRPATEDLARRNNLGHVPLDVLRLRDLPKTPDDTTWDTLYDLLRKDANRTGGAMKEA
jgi:ankyrin repeat protein